MFGKVVVSGTVMTFFYSTTSVFSAREEEVNRTRDGSKSSRNDRYKSGKRYLGSHTEGEVGSHDDVDTTGKEERQVSTNEWVDRDISEVNSFEFFVFENVSFISFSLDF